MTCAVINLELWYTYDEIQDQSKILKKIYDLAIKDFSKYHSPTTVIGLLLCEGFLYKNNDEFYSLLKNLETYFESKGVKNLILIPGIVCDYQSQLNLHNLKWEIIEWDYSVNAMYQSYKDRLEIIPQWNASTDKFLFLGGESSRKNRITLLSKYYDRKMLGMAEWSFFPPITDADRDWCRKELNHYNDETYERFISVSTRSIDSLYKEARHYTRINGKEWLDSGILENDFLNDPNFINPQIFSSTSVSVISEGHVYSPGEDFNFLTEKTWRAVINNHPFILADMPQRMDFIKSKGLKTFENYMAIKDYAYIDDYNRRLDAVVENTKNFQLSINKYYYDIKEDITQNFQCFFEIVKENTRVLDLLKNKYNISDEDIKYWFCQKSFTHLFRVPK